MVAMAEWGGETVVVWAWASKAVEAVMVRVVMVSVGEEDGVGASEGLVGETLVEARVLAKVGVAAVAEGVGVQGGVAVVPGGKEVEAREVAAA